MLIFCNLSSKHVNNFTEYFFLAERQENSAYVHILNTILPYISFLHFIAY